MHAALYSLFLYTAQHTVMRDEWCWLKHSCRPVWCTVKMPW